MAEGVVRRTNYIAPQMIDFCLQLSAYRLQSIGINAIINNQCEISLSIQTFGDAAFKRNVDSIIMRINLPSLEGRGTTKWWRGGHVSVRGL